MRNWIILTLLAGLALAACAGNVPGDLSPPSDEGPESPDATPTAEPLAEAPSDTAPIQENPPVVEPPGEDTLPPDELEGPPLIRLVVDGMPFEGYQGSYCWTGPTVALCVDKIPPEFDSAIALPAGEPIRLQLDAPLPDTVTLQLSDELFGEARYTETMPGATTLEWAVEAEPGPYILSAFAAWQSRGDVAYLFSVTLQ